MDDLNLFHVLSDTVEGIGHGVQLTAQNDVQSKTMVCYLDQTSNFHYGFCYKNGSNLRVVTWQNDTKKFKTVPKGSFVIAFNEEKTKKPIKGNFQAKDFEFSWFDETAKNVVKEELKSLIAKKDYLETVVQGLCGLTIQELTQVDQKIKELKND